MVATTRMKGRPRRNLTDKVIESLRERIVGGALTPGDQLPTEQKLVEAFGVSRTVVREAIAALRADRLIEARQGVGVFVLHPPEAAHGLSFLDAAPRKLSSVIEMLELRAAVEIEAAGLAAQRCSPAQEMRIRECYDDISAQVARGQTAEEADFAFHIAIASATSNQNFIEFLQYLGRRTIPRSQLCAALAATGARKDGSDDRVLHHERWLQSEHRRILDAICAGDGEAAREAMRVHLQGSLKRYRSLSSMAV